MEEDSVRKRKHKTSTESDKVDEKNCVPAKKLGRRPVRDENELCHVCGEKARSHNFGGMSCNCCKSFFRHFVLTNVKDNLSIERFKTDCKFKGDCAIDQVTRKKCKTCRFLKCVKIGMDPKWVIADYKTIQKNKATSNNKKTNCTQSGDIFSTLESNDQKLSDEDAIKVANISEFYKSACELIPYNFPSREDSSTPLTINRITILLIGVISTAFRRFVYFARMIPEFEKLSLHDQTSLLRGSAIQLFILRSSVTYDFENNMVNSKAENFPEEYPEITLDECAAICSDEVADMHVQVYRRIRNLAPDEASIMLMLPLVLFSDFGDICTQFEDRTSINAAQEFYANLLEKYLKSVCGVEKGRVVYPRLLSQLSGVAQISLLHQGHPLNMTDDQVDKMHKHLLALQRKASFPVLQETEKCTRIKEQKECCSKQDKSILSRKMSKLELADQSQPRGISADAFQIIIHSFANLTSNWGIKPEYFGKGAHLGIQNAFMRRIPELLNNPWDCLITVDEEDQVTS